MVRNIQSETKENSSENTRKMLHTMLRVGDMDRSIGFYTQVMGMRVLRTLHQPEDEYSLTFIGYDDESSSCVLELTYNYGVHRYDIGTGYGHIAISVDNCDKACKDIEMYGGRVTMKPVPLKGADEIIAFVSDPDGYQIELIERPAP